MKFHALINTIFGKPRERSGKVTPPQPWPRPVVDYADKSYLRQPTQAELRAIAVRENIARMGEKWCLANPSTLEYKPATEHVPNLAGKPVSALY